jgi:hypothetical protein
MTILEELEEHRKCLITQKFETGLSAGEQRLLEDINSAMEAYETLDFGPLEALVKEHEGLAEKLKAILDEMENSP